MRATLILLPLCFLAEDDNAKEAIERAKDSVEAVWPKSVPMPAGMAWYTKTRYAQGVSILNGNDHLEVIRSDGFKRDAIFPWTISGGLDRAKGWESRGAVAIPKGRHVRYWTEYIDGNAIRPLPKWRWRFPEGTVFADVLMVNGEVFELRTATKTADGWNRQVKFRDESKYPQGYTGLTKKCIDCHAYAGAWASYGSNLPGSDETFSWSPLQEGTILMDKTKAKHWNE